MIVFQNDRDVTRPGEDQISRTAIIEKEDLASMLRVLEDGHYLLDLITDFIPHNERTKRTAVRLGEWAALLRETLQCDNARIVPYGKKDPTI